MAFLWKRTQRQVQLCRPVSQTFILLSHLLLILLLLQLILFVIIFVNSFHSWAAVCWSIHYIKRLLETLFVHRFSHSTMPLRNLFKNCTYYWLFAMYVAYHVNHPLYTPPNPTRFIIGAAAFFLCELGNLSIHLALRNLRPPGTTIRKIPNATGNPFTSLFNLVSCPNYTYEVGSWIGFTIMTQCLPGKILPLTITLLSFISPIVFHWKNNFKEIPVIV
jgi:very-long-chain enoyl-CoA reductase